MINQGEMTVTQIEYLESIVKTFREANAFNAPELRDANEVRIAKLEESIITVSPFIEPQL